MNFLFPAYFDLPQRTLSSPKGRPVTLPLALLPLIGFFAFLFGRSRPLGGVFFIPAALWALAGCVYCFFARAADKKGRPYAAPSQTSAAISLLAVSALYAAALTLGTVAFSGRYAAARFMLLFWGAALLYLPIGYRVLHIFYRMHLRAKRPLPWKKIFTSICYGVVFALAAAWFLKLFFIAGVLLWVVWALLWGVVCCFALLEARSRKPRA